MSDSQNNGTDVIVPSESDILQKYFKDGVNISAEMLDAFITSTMGLSKQEVFGDASVYTRLKYRGAHYTLGYYHNPDVVGYTTNTLEIEDDGRPVQFIHDWLLSVDYNTGHSLMSMVADIYATFNDSRSWKNLIDERDSNDLLGAMGVAMKIQDTVNSACERLIEYHTEIFKVFEVFEKNNLLKANFALVYPTVNMMLTRTHYCLKSIIDLEVNSVLLVNAHKATNIVTNMIQHLQVLDECFRPKTEPKSLSEIDSLSIFNIQTNPEPEKVFEAKQIPQVLMMPCPPGVH